MDGGGGSLLRVYGLRVLPVLLGLILVACTGRPAVTFTGQFERVNLTESPAAVQAAFANLKALPGLYVLREGDQTYLLLLAGRAEQPGLDVAVLSLQKTSDTEVRLLAVVGKGEGSAADYPHAVIRLRAPLNMRFKARLSANGGQVTELQGMEVTDR